MELQEQALLSHMSVEVEGLVKACVEPYCLTLPYREYSRGLETGLQGAQVAGRRVGS